MGRLGIAGLGDKLLQRAVVEVLSSIDEMEFCGLCYGVRPGRSPHDALDAVAVGIVRKKVNGVLDTDIGGFYDASGHGWLLQFLQHRIADKRVLRLIQKWLGAGVIQNGTWTQSMAGTPQGASASPLLANLYLHDVLEVWADWWRRRHAHGEVIIVRFADDYLAGFEHQRDAQQFLSDLRERLAKCCLELAPGKRRLIEFGRHAVQRRRAGGLGRPESFEFLGFTHTCAKTNSGRFMRKRITISKRMRAKLREVNDQLKRRRHQPIPSRVAGWQAWWAGHLAYDAVPGNTDAVAAFRTQATRHWYRALRRRSQRTRLSWERRNRLATRWLPPARPLHPWPNVRFDARTQDSSPVR
jgi:RNA-directed DNA polymerase